MKTLFFLLLGAVLLLGGWLLMYGPLDAVREPGRLAQQIAPDQVRLLTDAEVQRLKQQAEPPAGAPAAEAPTLPPAPSGCVLIVNVSSESMARRLRARLADAGLDEQAASESENNVIRLRVNGVDAPARERMLRILKDYPRLSLENCPTAAAH